MFIEYPIIMGAVGVDVRRIDKMECLRAIIPLDDRYGILAFDSYMF